MAVDASPVQKPYPPDPDLMNGRPALVWLESESCDLEVAFVGGLMLRPELIEHVDPLIVESDFQDYRLRPVLRAIRRLREEGAPITLPLLHDRWTGPGLVDT